MTDQPLDPNQTIPSSPQVQTPPEQHGIINQTLGELLTTNTQAQGLIMKAMHINPEQLQEMLKTTNSNPMMNQTIGELFKNGTMKQAAVQGGQISPEQVEHIVNILPDQEQSTIQSPQVASQTSDTTSPTSKPSFTQKVKDLFS